MVAYVFVGLATLTVFPLVWSDEAWYTQSAWSLSADGSFALPMFADFAELDVDNTVYGRLYMMAVAAAFEAMGVSAWSARLVSFLSGIVAITAVFAVGRELWSPRVGLLAALLLAVSPVFVDQTHDARPEIMQIAVTMVAFYLLLLGVRLHSHPLVLSSGVTAALAADVHLNGLIVPVALFVVLLVLRANRQLAVSFAVGAGIGAAWWLALHVLPDPERFFAQSGA